MAPPPDWSDVDFDHARAAAAAAQCRSAAGALDSILSGRMGLAPTEQWTGSYKDRYAAEEPALFGELERLRDDLRKLATRIERASTLAAREQRSRERARDEWRRDHLPPTPGDLPGGAVPVAA